MSAIAESRIDPELKRQAEAVLEEIGLKPRAALELYYKQIIKRRAIPFPVQADSPEDEVLSPAARRNALVDEFQSVRTVPQPGLACSARTDGRVTMLLKWIPPGLRCEQNSDSLDPVMQLATGKRKNSITLRRLREVAWHPR